MPGVVVVNILVVDLEATCSDDGSIPLEQAEIIEIGAVLVQTDSLNDYNPFQSFVRPVRNTILTPFCTKLTTITQEQIDESLIFEKTYPRFADWLNRCGGAEVFASWGDWDWKQLHKECGECRYEFPIKRNVSIPNAARKLLGFSNKFRLARHFGIKWQGTLHRGIDDARNYASIVVKMLEIGWKP